MGKYDEEPRPTKTRFIAKRIRILGKTNELGQDKWCIEVEYFTIFENRQKDVWVLRIALCKTIQAFFGFKGIHFLPYSCKIYNQCGPTYISMFCVCNNITTLGEVLKHCKNFTGAENMLIFSVQLLTCATWGIYLSRPSLKKALSPQFEIITQNCA